MLLHQRRLFVSKLLLVTLSVALNVDRSVAAVTTIVAPTGLENTEGNGSGSRGTLPFRLQYLYSSSYFDSLPGARDLISLAWRPDQTSGSIVTTSDSMILRLSTIEVDELSMEFAENTGDDATVVYNAPFTFETSADQQPRGFDFDAQFATPFQYNPAKGNLLVDATFSGFDDGNWWADNQEFPGNRRLLIVGDDPDSEFAARSWDILAAMEFTFESALKTGDFNEDGVVSIADLDVMTLGDPAFDITGDGTADRVDLETMVHDLVGTWVGDSDGDGVFSSSDLVSVLAAGRYEAGPTAKWSQGDWSLDDRFDSTDFVVALADGGFEQGPRAAVMAVPEPSSLVMIVAGIFGFLQSRSRQVSQRRPKCGPLGNGLFRPSKKCKMSS